MHSKIRLGLVSDLHGEELIAFQNERKMRKLFSEEVYGAIDVLTPPTKHLDVLMLAGDICEFRFPDIWERILGQASSYAEQVVVVDGNHEHWRTKYQYMPEHVAKLEAKFPNVKFLNNESLVVGDVEIFGGCFWTDFGKNDYIMMEVSDRYSTKLSDRNIQKIKWRKGGTRNIRATDIQLLAMKAKDAVAKWLDTDSKGKVRVLLSHYPPVGDKVHIDNSNGKIPEDMLEDLKKIEYNDMTDLLSQHSDVIVAHGHLHGVESYISNETGNPVFTNPRGTVWSGTDPREYRILEFVIDGIKSTEKPKEI